MDSDEDRVAAIARMLIDDGYVDNDTEARQAAARILQVVQTHLPSEAPAAARIPTPGAATRD